MKGGANPKAVQAMFARVARRYDLLNRVLSLGQDQRWRRFLRQAVAQAPAGPVLDLATGTGDVALGAFQRPVVGVDFCLEMLALARRKPGRPVPWRYWVAGDVQALPFAEGLFAAVTVAFGWRNFPDPVQAFGTVGRVLKKGGRLAILEFHPVQRQPWRTLHRLWQRWVIQPVGSWVSGDPQAYRYLPETSNHFLTPEALERAAALAGFSLLGRRYLGLQVACLSVFVKKG
ncbi:MAG: ubiquinone/menaquinone biosynthesis methyltransferase [Thermoanaerobaculum sp.]|nr:ubiquinone/menaquinone biosynthesis methyltransferase [Thermoanaerobaculum sp.]MCX7894812.1 ubiquinone/menaquinone biosynthesis methyltransferase [Thermoanaerobaculum sp.]MDW7967480.1 ubiquinone/menaquinone biosynthesis methyltransferase [Thermoanaerobaculum sp.]